MKKSKHLILSLLITTSLVSTNSIALASPSISSHNENNVGTQAFQVCSYHGDAHRPDGMNSIRNVEIKETKERTQMTMSRCACGEYIWYENYPCRNGLGRHFYGDPNDEHVVEAKIEHNSTYFIVSKSSLRYGNDPSWVFSCRS